MPASTLTVTSAGSYSTMRLSRPSSITRSRRVGGLPRPCAVPAPRGATASPSACARPRSRLTSATFAGRATKRGATPSTAADAPSARCSAPTTARRRSPRALVMPLDPGPGRDPDRRPDAQALAAGGMGRQELAGVHDVVRVPRAPEPRHEVEVRSEEHTSELQSHSDLVCRLLLEKKKKNVDNAQ